MENIERWWLWFVERWQMTATPPLWIAVLAALGMTALCLYRPTWKYLRHAATVTHEMGHVMIAWLFGRRVSGVSLHSDTSGLTISSGKPRGMGVLMTYLGGYPAPSLVGTALVWSALAGWSGVGLTLMFLLLVLTFWLIRNLFGLLVITITLGITGWVWWLGEPLVGTTYVLLVGVLLTIAGVRCVGDLAHAQKQGGEESASTDAAMAAAHSILPAGAWVGFFWIVNVAAAVQATVFIALALTGTLSINA